MLESTRSISTGAIMLKFVICATLFCNGNHLELGPFGLPLALDSLDGLQYSSQYPHDRIRHCSHLQLLKHFQRKAANPS